MLNNFIDRRPAQSSKVLFDLKPKRNNFLSPTNSKLSLQSCNHEKINTMVSSKEPELINDIEILEILSDNSISENDENSNNTP